MHVVRRSAHRAAEGSLHMDKEGMHALRHMCVCTVSNEEKVWRVGLDCMCKVCPHYNACMLLYVQSPCKL